MIVIFSFLIMFEVTIGIAFVFMLGIESIFLACVKYYYVEGEYYNWIYIYIYQFISNNK